MRVRLYRDQAPQEPYQSSQQRNLSETPLAVDREQVNLFDILGSNSGIV